MRRRARPLAAPAVLELGDSVDAVVAARIRRQWEHAADERPGRAGRLRVTVDPRMPGQSYRLQAADDGVDVTAGSALGAAYGVAEVVTSTWSVDGRALLHLLTSGEVRRPLAPTRTMYFNVARNLSHPGITPDTWDTSEWEAVVDALVAARYSRIAFYLWADCELAYPGTAAFAQNLLLHERLRHAMRYAREWGLEAAYWFAPMAVPQELAEQRADLRSPAPYPPGYPALCPSRPGSLELAEHVYRGELEWFAEADAFQIWFYDPGGCFCTQCRPHLAEVAFAQATHFAALIRRLAPHAQVEISAWPVWANEQQFGVDYREAFVAELHRFATESDGPITVLDTPAAPTNVLADAAAAGCGRAAFYLGTNVETGFPFLTPSLPLLGEIQSQAIAEKFDDVVPMRIERGTKWPQDDLLGALLWAPTSDVAGVVDRLSRHWADGDRAGEALASALVAWDELLRLGALAVPTRLAPMFRDIPTTPTVALLAASARAIDALADMARGNSAGTAALEAALDDPLLRPVAPVVRRRRDAFAEMVGAGQLAGDL